MTLEPIIVYTDGASRSLKGHREVTELGWGWLAINPPPGWRQARVSADRIEGPRLKSQGCKMESKAILEAIDEFSPKGRPIIVRTDSQALPRVIEKYRAGEVSSHDFLQSERFLSEGDTRRLLRLLETVELTIEWVRGHSLSFENMVVDQALRHAVYGGYTETHAEEFMLQALERQEAMILTTTSKRGKPMRKALRHVRAEEFASRG